MIGAALEAIRVLAGDALIAAGELIRGGSDDVDVWPDHFMASAMECDGPDSTKPIPFDEIRAALDELPDSVLIRSAAMLVQQTVVYTPNPFVDALRDRADQFEAAELAAGNPSLSPRVVGAPPDQLVAPRRVKETAGAPLHPERRPSTPEGTDSNV